jgi:hypothetical protein
MACELRLPSENSTSTAFSTQTNTSPALPFQPIAWLKGFFVNRPDTNGVFSTSRLGFPFFVLGWQVICANAQSLIS